MFYPSVLNTIHKKKGNSLQPLFEAFTNSFEALENKSEGQIEVCIYLSKDLIPDDSDLANFNKITIKDNGIGLNDTQFNRLKMLRDSRKGPSNKGTGRIQFIHYFDETNITSVYEDDSPTGYRRRSITLSKSKEFLDRNSIIRIDSEDEIDYAESMTLVTFINPLENFDSHYYTKLNAFNLKEEFLRHYLALFCEFRKNFPKLSIKIIINKKEKEVEIIEASEIPLPNKTIPIHIHYSKVENNKITPMSKKEIFELKAFRLGINQLEKNEIKLVSKGEIAKALYFDGLLPKEEINGERFLFLLSGKYIDEKDTDTRGQIKILDNHEFLNQYKEYLSSDNDNYEWINQKNEEILLSDIENVTNNEILKNYPEIDVLRKEKNDKIDELKEMFLLNPNTIIDSKITINDSYEDILTKVYREEARLIAKKDALFREHFRKIKKLTPNKDNYQNDLNNAVEELIKDIPLRDKISLTKYIARRRLVLDVFNNILNNEEKKKEIGGRIDESILHNLIFQQTSSNTEDSDLWLINEEFIYFKGTSESSLSNLKYEGKKIIKDNTSLAEEQIKYLNSLNKKKIGKKTRYFTFPK